jgi:hypothetical protein
MRQKLRAYDTWLGRALAVTSLIGGALWVPPVYAQQAPAVLNGIEVIGVGEGGGPRASAFLLTTETVSVIDGGGPRSSALLQANEGVGVGDSLPASAAANRPPTAVAGGPYTVEIGGSVQLTGSGTDPDGDTLTFDWDLDNNGTFETPGQNPLVAPTGSTGDVTVVLRVCDPAPACSTATAMVHVVAPTGGGGLPGEGPPGVVGATPELDSLTLFGSGLTGLSAYLVMRLRARRRR